MGETTDFWFTANGNKLPVTGFLFPVHAACFIGRMPAYRISGNLFVLF